MKLPRLVLYVLLIEIFTIGRTSAQPSAVEIAFVPSQSSNIETVALTNDGELENFKREALRLATMFDNEVKGMAYQRSDGTKGLHCSGSGQELEDRRTYFNRFVAANIHLLTPGSSEYNSIIEFQNTMTNLSNLAIQACDDYNKRR